MKRVSSSSGRQLSPNRRGYNLVLYALANSKRTDAGERAQAILQTMKEEDAAGDFKSRLDVNSHNQVITAHCRGRRHGFEYKAQAAFDELMELPKAWNVTPNTDTFNAILGCWLKSKNTKALARMKEIMNLMQKCHSEGNDNARPNHITANTMITALGKGQENEALETTMAFYKDMESTYDISRNAFNNNILIDSYAKSGRSDAHDCVLELLRGMEDEFIRGNSHVKPDAFSYSSAIDCLVRRGKPDAGKQAEAIIEQMRDLHHNHGGDAPTAPVYNACLNAWASSNTDKGVDRAEAMLREMEECHETHDYVPAPNRITYNTVLKALRTGRSDHALRAETLLNRMEEQGKHDCLLTPDSYSYTSVITAIARSLEPDKATRALFCLKRMIDSYEAGNLAAKPNIPAFNACLNACAFCTSDNERHRTEAFVITVAIIVLLRKYCEPDHLTYGTVLRAVSTLLPLGDERRDYVAESIFKRACREGTVDNMVMTQLKFATSSEMYESLTGVKHGDTVRLRNLPRGWIVNVREQYKRTR